MADLIWSPIKDFIPEEFPDGKFFLVWIKPEGDEGFPQIGQWDHEYDAEGKSDGEKRITGEWRHTDLFQGLDPVAFASIPSPTERLRLWDEMKEAQETSAAKRAAMQAA